MNGVPCFSAWHCASGKNNALMQHPIHRLALRAENGAQRALSKAGSQNGGIIIFERGDRLTRIPLPNHPPPSSPGPRSPPPQIPATPHPPPNPSSKPTSFLYHYYSSASKNPIPLSKTSSTSSSPRKHQKDVNLHHTHHTRQPTGYEYGFIPCEAVVHLYAGIVPVHTTQPSPSSLMFTLFLRQP